MGNYNHCSPSEHCPELFLDLPLGDSVERVRGFIENDNRPVRENCASQSNPLFLSSRQLHAALANARFISVGKHPYIGYVVVDIGKSGRARNLFGRSVWTREANVVGESVVVD